MVWPTDELNTRGTNRVKMAGSFGFELLPTRRQGDRGRAYYTFPVTAGTDIQVYSDVAGGVGNALDFQATADGSAKAAIDFDVDAGLTQLDTIMEFKTGGTGGNDWKVSVMAGSGGGEGVNIGEDTTNKLLTIMYEDGVSTVTNVETAIGLTTNFAVRTGGTGASVLAAGDDDLAETNLTGGTAATYAVESGSPSKTHLHYTDAVTTVTAAVAALNTLSSGTKMMTATGSGAHTLAAGDAVAKQDLAGGAATSGVRGLGFSVAYTSVGTFTVTFDDSFPTMISAKACLQLATAADQFAQVGTYTAASKTLVFYVWDKSDNAVANVAIAAGNRLNFICEFANTDLG